MRHLWILLSLFFIIHIVVTENSDREEYDDEPETANSENAQSQGVEEYDQNDDDFSQFNRMEGDIVVRKSEDSNSALHAALSDKSKRWRNGIVPYKRGPRIINHPFKATILKGAMDEIMRRTCVKFIPNVDNLPDYVLFKAPPGQQCSSEIGRIGGRQNVTLTDDCFTRATIQHELLHVLGFVHEQNRPDRDEWVEIKWENIKDGEEDQPDRYKKNFNKRKHEEVDLAKTGYSYESIMHYGKNDFSRDENKLPTVVAKKPGGDKIGNRDYLAEIDVLRINIIYECKDHLHTTPMTKILPSVPPTWIPPPETERPPTRPPTRQPPTKSKSEWRAVHILDISSYGDYNANEITKEINGNHISFKGATTENGWSKWFNGSFTTFVNHSEIRHFVKDGKLIFLAPEDEVADKNGEIYTYN